MRKKQDFINLLTWLFYDSGNSVITASLGGLFLAQWLIIDLGYSDIWYGIIFSLSTLIVLLTAPLLGAWSDRVGARFPFIFILTLILYLLSLSLAIVTNLNLKITTLVVIVSIIGLLMQALYQYTLVFTDSLLEVLSTEKNRGSIAGLAGVFNNLGWLFATTVLLVFSEGMIPAFGDGGRHKVFIPAFIFFVFLTLPFLLFFKEPKTKERIKAPINVKDVFSSTIQDFKKLFTKNKNIGIYLVGFALVADAVLTISLYFAVTMERLYGVSDVQKFSLIALMFLWVAVGSYSFGKLGDKFGSKKMLINSVLLMCISLLLAFFIMPLSILYVLMITLGLGMGGFFVTSKALLIEISPKEKLGEYFGYYSTFARLSSIVGPIAWGLTILLLDRYEIFRYQMAGFTLAFIMSIGVYLISKVQTKILS